jgi:hypothetical protein
MRPLLAALAVALSLLAARPGLAEPDRTGVQAVIERQLEAFARDDAAGAYGFAAPSIQAIFPDEAAFMAMVQRAYPPVYRSRARRFAETTELPDGGVAQAVRLQDEAGEDWVALYTLERGPDGAWRITGCTLQRVPSQAA